MLRAPVSGSSADMDMYSHMRVRCKFRCRVERERLEEYVVLVTLLGSRLRQGWEMFCRA